MTDKTLKRAENIKYELFDIGRKEEALSMMKKLNPECFIFSSLGYDVPINKELAENLIPIIKKYYREQREKLEKEFSEL